MTASPRLLSRRACAGLARGALALLCALACVGTSATQATPAPSASEHIGTHVAASSATTPAASTPKVYKYLQSGVPAYSDIPPRRGAYIVWSASCYACNLNSTINWHATKLHLLAYSEVIAEAARQHALDPALVRAVIHAESGFNSHARSRKGAVGLMQLMPATAREVGVADARVPAQNIRGGAQYLASLLAQFRGDITLAAAAYNAGPAAVAKYAGIPPYAETQVYVQRVKILHRRYREQIQG